MHSASRTLAALFLCLTALVGNSPSSAAQTLATAEQTRVGGATTVTPQPRKIARRTAPGRRATAYRRRQAPAPAERGGNPVALVNRSSEPEFLVGQAEVVVKGNQDPIIRLGLAQHGPTVVEFPASDNFFAVHPGGSNVVAVDESPTLATDHYLVFRAGKEFAAPLAVTKRRTEPEAAISVQMTSGMFVTFMFYPVASVAQMAHRCVVIYSREEIVAARRAAGLAVNLDGKDPLGSIPAAASKRVAENTAPTPPASITTDTSATTNNQTQNASIVLPNSAAAAPSTKKQSRANMVDEARRALRSALAAPAKFSQWSDPVHDISLSASILLELDDTHRLMVVAIKNRSASALRLVADQPDLDLVTCDERGRPVQTQSLAKLHVETTSPTGAIPAGTTVYYAVVYETPVLGAAQRLRLSVAQIAAADEPTAVSVPE
jgi:hypothetical protein